MAALKCMTERKIAQAFAQAADEGAVLVIDEVDTFLGARAQAGRPWEISLVNEFLVQIERHSGLVICTTNRLEGLDEAALRRFALKVEFLPLAPNQIVAMYAEILAPLAKGGLTDAQTARLRGLHPVTVADMTLVRRNLEMTGARRARHDRLLEDLEKEVSLKPQVRSALRTVGF